MFVPLMRELSLKQMVQLRFTCREDKKGCRKENTRIFFILTTGKRPSQIRLPISEIACIGMVQRNEAQLSIVCESEKQASDRVLYQDAEIRAPPSSPSWFLSLSLSLSFPLSYPHPFSLFLSLVLPLSSRSLSYVLSFPLLSLLHGM